MYQFTSNTGTVIKNLKVTEYSPLLMIILKKLTCTMERLVLIWLKSCFYTLHMKLATSSLTNNANNSATKEQVLPNWVGQWWRHVSVNDSIEVEVITGTIDNQHGQMLIRRRQITSTGIAKIFSHFTQGWFFRYRHCCEQDIHHQLLSFCNSSNGLTTGSLVKTQYSFLNHHCLQLNNVPIYINKLLAHSARSETLAHATTNSDDGMLSWITWIMTISFLLSHIQLPSYTDQTFTRDTVT